IKGSADCRQRWTDSGFVLRRPTLRAAVTQDVVRVGANLAPLAPQRDGLVHLVVEQLVAENRFRIEAFARPLGVIGSGLLDDQADALLVGKHLVGAEALFQELEKATRRFTACVKVGGHRECPTTRGETIDNRGPTTDPLLLSVVCPLLS